MRFRLAMALMRFSRLPDVDGAAIGGAGAEAAAAAALLLLAAPRPSTNFILLTATFHAVIILEEAELSDDGRH